MDSTNRTIWPRILLLTWAVLVVAGCAGQRAFKAGEDLVLEEKYDAAVANFSAAASTDPHNHEYRLKLNEAKARAAWAHLERGRELLKEDKKAEAVGEFQTALEYDGTLGAAAQAMTQARAGLRADQLIADAEGFYRARRFSQARNSLEEALNLDPGNAAALALQEKIKQGRKTIVDGFELDVTSEKPITLKFKETGIKDVFNILSKLSGINFILDEDIRSQNITLLLEDASFPQALELILQMNKLGKKVLNGKTIIIFPKTKEKDKQFEDQLIQTFYLSNIDAKKAVNLLRTMLQLRKIYVHEELNALVIRDSAEVIKLARQILESADRADSEVTFDLELIEVNHGDQLDLGPKLSTNSIGLGMGKLSTTTATTGSVSTPVLVADSLSGTANLVTGLSGLQAFYTLPSATFDFLKTQSDAEVLANPKIRVKNKEKAKVHIGSREPVITVTMNGDNRSDNVQYVDVGVKLEVEPNIQLDDSIVTKLNLEVSSVSSRLKTDNGTQVLTITTTNAQTGLTLQDGERTIIGGLIRDDKSNSRSTIPILGDLPLIGSLFTSHSKTKNKREILLSITPHIVKTVVMPRPDQATIWSGGEDDLKAGPAFGAFAGSFEPVSEQVPASAAPAEEKPVEVMPSPLPRQPETPPAPEAGNRAPAAPPESPTVSLPVEPAPVPSPSPGPVAEELFTVPPFALPPEGAGQVAIRGPANLTLGEEVTLEVAVQGVEHLFSAPLFVVYDSLRLELVRAEEADFLRQGGQTTIFTSSGIPTRGQLIVGYKQGLGGLGASGEGTLFKLVLRAKAPGQATVSLDRINFRDPSGNRLKVASVPLVVEVR